MAADDNNRAFFNIISMLAAFFVLVACRMPPVPAPPTANEPGQVMRQEDVYGTFFTYVPTTVPEKPEILILVHGTPPKDETAEANAEFYISNWIDFAEEQGFILIAPVFNQEDFSSRYGDHAMSGYRGLFGREIDADGWVLRLVNRYEQLFESNVNLSSVNFKNSAIFFHRFQTSAKLACRS